MKLQDGYPDANIVYHGERQRPFAQGVVDAEAIEAIASHIERHLGPVEQVYHETISDLVHVDLHWVRPTTSRPFNTLVTSGMSFLPMNAPPGNEAFRFAELMITLPADWPMTIEAWRDERIYWPIRLLKNLSRLPHEHATWLWLLHTVGDPDGEPYHASTRQNTALIAPCLSARRAFGTLDLPPRNKTVHFFAVLPLYPEEVRLKLSRGGDALLDRLDQHGIRDVVDPARPSCAEGRNTRPGWQRWLRGLVGRE
jgi:hypothetical protein